MMDRQKGLVIFECDGCGELLETGLSNMAEANEARNEAEWRAIPPAPGRDEWTHKCPECK